MPERTISGAGPPRPPGPETTNDPHRFSACCRTVSAAPSVSGFSLIELLAVIAVLAVALAVVVPRLPGLDGYSLDSATGRLSRLSGFLNERAASKRSFYRVWFDFAANEVRVEASEDGQEYAPEPEGALRTIKFGTNVFLEEVRSPGLGSVKRGEAAIVFSPHGSEPFEVRLSSAERSAVVSFNPYTGRAKVHAPEKNG